MAAEYETIAAAGQHDRWATLMRTSGLTEEQAEAAVGSDAFGPLAAELRRAEANGNQVERLLPAVVARHGLSDADDVAAVLRHRIGLATSRPRGRRATSPRLIVGLIPEALGPMAPDMREALDERRDLIEQRARDLAADAVCTKDPWVRRLGEPPVDRRELSQWNQAVVTLAAYRDRYAITSSKPLGDKATTDVQRLDRSRAMLAQTRLQGASDARGRNASVDRGAMGI